MNNVDILISYSIDTIQMTLLENIEMKRLFKCMELFVGWLQGGLYDYSSLPISMFNHLKEDDKMILELIPETYSGTFAIDFMN